ncbi:hypothetical protein NQZ68_005142 [Dissostichus eleginoides]|nr:hypothetical protein NQZ68_005142 [Dissostichus eleginoides]
MRVVSRHRRLPPPYNPPVSLSVESELAIGLQQTKTCPTLHSPTVPTSTHNLPPPFLSSLRSAANAQSPSTHQPPKANRRPPGEPCQQYVIGDWRERSRGGWERGGGGKRGEEANWREQASYVAKKDIKTSDCRLKRDTEERGG